MEASSQETQIGNRVFQQFMDIFIIPELHNRQKKGILLKPLELKAAQVIFFPDGRKPEIRINSEVKGLGKMKLKPSISKTEGETEYAHEIEDIGGLEFHEGMDADCGHATLLRMGDRWFVLWDARYNKALSRKHLEAAREFYEAATFSFDRRNWIAFIDNLFSAAELAIKAELFSIPDPDFREKANHKCIHSRYNRFMASGNAKPIYLEVFNKLFALRSKARYLKDDISVSESDGSKWLNAVREIIDIVVSREGA
jgi:hypothetical protein